MIELSENFEYKKKHKNFVFEGGQLYIGHRAFGGRTDKKVDRPKINEVLNKYIKILS
jgi:hypothetical protein